MAEAAEITAEQIVAHVRNAYAIDARWVESLELGADASAAVYRIVGVDAAFSLKLRHGESHGSAALARFLVDVGRMEVLAPLLACNGQLTTRLGAFAAALYPFVEGSSGFERRLTEQQWAHLGAALRGIHDVVLPAMLRRAIRVETYAPVWRDRVRVLLAAGVLPSADAVTQELGDLLTTKHAQIVSLVEHAEELAAIVRARSPALVPCHGDLHAGNVLTAGDGEITIVDWDDPVLAARERDLMFIGGGVGGTWNKPEESAGFYRGYGRTTLDAEALAYYRCERIIEDVAAYSDELLHDADGRTDRPRALRALVGAFRAGDVVEIAERTVAEL